MVEQGWVAQFRELHFAREPELPGLAGRWNVVRCQSLPPATNVEFLERLALARFVAAQKPAESVAESQAFLSKSAELARARAS